MSILTLVACAVLFPGAADPAPDSRTVRTKDGTVLKVETAVTGLEVPWSIAFTSAARMLVTERPGRVRVVENGVLRAAPLAVISDVESRGETGLMGLTLAPDYEESRFLYVSYAYTGPGGIHVRVVRFHDDGTGLSQRRVIVEGLPAARFHAGCRLRFGPDGKLYVTTGDATTREIAQELDSLGGKTLRLNPDGTIPADNPFPGSPVFSYGHRNSQGLDWQLGGTSPSWAVPEPRANPGRDLRRNERSHVRGRRTHPPHAPARAFFQEAMKEGRQLVTSAEVLQKLLDAYLPVGRVATLDAALTLAEACIPVVWPVEAEDIRAARTLAGRHSSLGARDLLHLACCRRHGARQIKTFDRGLAAAFAGR